MEAKRIIPCLDIKNGHVVKGVHFANLQEVNDPVVLAKAYCEQGADELVFYDITASVEGRTLFTELLEKVAKVVTVPLIAGGGIATLADFEQVLAHGADKISVNSGAINDPALIRGAAKQFGSQRIIFSMDAKLVGDTYHVFAKGGQEDTGIDALDWAAKAEADGAGELVVNSIWADGAKTGFDLSMLKAIAGRVKLPIIASGGAGSMQDFADLFQIPGIDAGLAASVFHFGEVSIPALKEFLASKNIAVRI